MNQRIRELAVAAAPANSSIPHSEWNIPKEFIEKFAELIVQECADAIINDDRLNDVRSASRGCIRTIKEHFGVE